MSVASTPTDETSARASFGLRLVAACGVLVALALVQDPGLLVADTKFDLVAAPADWLARALHLWDSEGSFGQVQNQAYGYLWPMGPFFVLGALIDVPGWVIQRLWQGLIMSVALVGTARVARALGVRSDLACLVAAFAFALSPRLLSSLGPISIEVWPSALVPWVLLPLVRGSSAGSPRRAAALSALAVAMVGGVNAAATLVVLPLGAVWLLTRTPGPRRRSLMLWWPLFTALGTLWWLVPLAVMGAYSPPFLDYTETAAVTTFPTTLFDALRGTVHWVPYVDPGWRAGNDLVTTSWLAVNSGVLVLLGLVGLIDRRTPHRGFLALSVLLGVLLVTMGHQGAVEGWPAGSVNGLLDGALAPIRNLHKFDAVIRLPMVLGLAFVLDRILAARREDPVAPRAERFNRAVLVGAAVLALAGTATPVLQTRVEQAGATLAVPDYWQKAADYLAAESEGGTTLVVPGSRFAEYEWGDPNDEPLQWLADSRWAVRNVGILAEPGYIRMLDGIEDRFTTGRGSEGLTASLRRSGVERLVVRNDLRRSDDVPDMALVYQAIEQSPGIVRSATFGPALGGEAHLRNGLDRVLVNGGWQARRPAIEVFEVTSTSRPAVSSQQPAVVVAGPEDLPDLLETDVLGSAPVQFAADIDVTAQGDRPGRVVLTDGLRARERAFARIHDGASATLTPGDARRTSGPVRDYLVPGADRWSTRARLDGAAALSASSSRSDSDAVGGSRRGALPYAALDGAADTAWESGLALDERGWWRLDLEAARAFDAVTLTAGTRADEQVLRVRTAYGVSAEVLLSPGGTRRVLLPRGADDEATMSWLRVEDASESGGRPLSLAEVDVPGLSVERVLDLPSLPEAWGTPDAVVLQADDDPRTGCLVVDGEERCVAGRDRTAEDGPSMRRSFELADGRDYRLSLTVRPRAGVALDDLVLTGQPALSRVSSLALPDPRAGAVAAIDRDRSTAWLADPDDEEAELTLAWLGRRPVSGIDLDLDTDTAARLPDRVRLSFVRGSRTVEREVELGLDGRATFPVVRADGMTVQALSTKPVTTVGFDGVVEDVPVGVGEVTVFGVPFMRLALSSDEVVQPCGSGPELEVGGRILRTAVVASAAQLHQGQEVPAEVCGAEATDDVVTLSAGTVKVVADRSPAFDAARVVLTAVDEPSAAAPPRPAGLDLSGPVRRSLDPAPGSRVVALRENANSGWVATQDGQDLASVTLDGWQQGFELRGDGPVEVRFAPDGPYRLGLLLGVLAVLGLLLAVTLTRRRWAGPEPSALGERRLGSPPAGMLALLAAGLVAGTGGLLVGSLALAALHVLIRRAPEAAPWVLAGPVLAAAVAYSLAPWASPAGWAGAQAWVGYLCVVPLVAVAASAAGRRDSTPRSRIPGSSTKR